MNFNNDEETTMQQVQTEVVTPIREVSRRKPDSNPLAIAIDSINKRLGLRRVENVYAKRNSPDVVKPFLASLEVRYMILDNAIFVKSEEILIPKLVKLDFRDIDAALPNTKYVQTELAVTKKLGFARLYHAEHNIELHIVPDKKWNNLVIAKRQAESLNIGDTTIYLATFVNLLTVLLDVL